MTTTQQGMDPAGDPVASARASRGPWRWLVPLVAVGLLLTVITLIFGGPTFGKLVMNDLDGHTYTVTAADLAGDPVEADVVGLELTFRNGRVTWPAGCNEASSAYAIRWTTLELTGAAVSTAMGCEGDVNRRGVALGRVLHEQPAVQVDDNNRLVLVSASGTIDLLESA